MDTNGVAATPLLLDAKREYIARLTEVLSPFVLKVIDNEYTEAQKQGRKVWLSFQHRMKSIVDWNASVISAQTNAIQARTPWINDLIAAVFVSYVKVLSSIKLNSDRPNIRLKLPSNESFIHQVFISTARAFYETPLSVRDADASTRQHMVMLAIESAVREMLPLADILRAYLGSSIDGDQTLNPVPSDNEEEEEEEEEEEDEPADDDWQNAPAPAENKLIAMQPHDFSAPAPAAPAQPAYADAAQPLPPPTAFPTPAPVPQAFVPQAQAPLAPQAPPPQAPLPPQAPAQPQPLFSDAEDGDKGFR